MKEGEWQQSEKCYSNLIFTYTPSDFFTDEALAQNLSKNEWEAIQEYHDTIALRNNKNDVKHAVNKLEKATNLTFPELKKR